MTQKNTSSKFGLLLTWPVGKIQRIQEVSNMNLKGTKKKNQVSNANIFEQQELLKKIEVVRENLTASTWHELETKGKFDKNAKLSFICDDMLILGCDVGSETHYLRAIDTRGRELSKSAFSFSNNVDGFSKAEPVMAGWFKTKNNLFFIVFGCYLYCPFLCLAKSIYIIAE